MSFRRILSQLNPQQQEAVLYDEGPLLILAGAGSGKTRTLTYKVAYLALEKKVRPEEILLVTFTNKAAEEMKNRVKELLAQESEGLPYAGTFHSFCAQVLRREGQKLPFGSNFVIYDEKDQLETVKQAMVELDLSEKKTNPAAVLNTISQAKNELLEPGEYQEYAQGFFQKTVAQIFTVYQKLMTEYHALDFDDLLLQAAKLFENSPETLAKYQDRYRYFLIDEYQDTNHAQYQLTKLLTKKEKKLCVVGDCSQSIYSWRGADYRNLMSLSNDFPQLKTINLEQNYRSTANILEAANKVISRNTSHPILNLWTEKEKGEKIGIFEASNEKEEALFVIQKLQEGVLAGKKLNDFAVLYRTNSQSRVFEEALLKNSLPYALIGGIRFYERKEVKDCLAYLRLLINPNDLVAYQRVQKLGKRKLNSFFQFSEEVKGKNNASLELLDGVLEKTGYLEKFNPKDEEDAGRLENIKELRSVAAQFPDLGDFLENVSLIQHENLPESQKRLAGPSNQMVNLMTIHAAKGTEFPVVFLVGMEENLFPHARSLEEGENLEEERRLCYVGLTRAKEKLYLSYAARRMYFGQSNFNPPSRFLEDIPARLMEICQK